MEVSFFLFSLDELIVVKNRLFFGNSCEFLFGGGDVPGDLFVFFPGVKGVEDGASLGNGN